MCYVVGFFGFENCIKKTLSSMKKVQYRGRDFCGVYDGKNVLTAKNIDELESLLSSLQSPVSNLQSPISIGHLLHSIVSFVLQPLKRKGVLVSNCEIYNWKDLAQKYKFKARNDSDLLLRLLDLKGLKNVKSVLNELDGSYSFAYLRDDVLVLSRDVLGIKPLFYFYDEKLGQFAFSSEKKVLNFKDLKNVKELDPKEILFYDLKSKSLRFEKKKFFVLKDPKKEDYNKVKSKVKKLLFDAIIKRVPENQKIGVLFSGGVDSTFIAYVLKELGVDFTCYTAKALGGNIEEAQDLIYAKEISQKYGFKLKVAKVDIKGLERDTKKVMKLIEDRDYIKVSVALPFFLACREARKNGVRVMFSGIGSEEIFAGYNRHKKVEKKEVNSECLEGLKILHIRDLYRDDVVTMANTIELRTPFLDKKLIEYCLNIDPKYKLDLKKNVNKIVLRDVAKEIGLDEKYAMRKKQAAQYGSKFDKGLLRLAKDKGLSKQDYLNSLDIKGVEKVFW